jgi:glycerophosphoryl diester phosphodiesterase
MKALITAGLCLLSLSAMAAEDKIIIAHRGASGYVPEHTLEAYAMAHALGAHYIEPDLVLTKDGRFVAMHDIHLESTTNVEEVFPDRKRADGRWYAIDFTLEEIKQLRAEERLKKRFPQGMSKFEIPTFEEVIELVQGINQSTGREAGIYPELKSPGFHAREGQPMEEKFLEVVKAYGYEGPDARIFVQCFEPAPLKRMRHELGSTLPQILLMGDIKPGLTEERLAEIATFANGIGPDKAMVDRDPELVPRAHAAGLKVHPYTVRRDQKPPRFESTLDEIRHILITRGADGLFCDFPDDGIAALR